MPRRGVVLPLLPPTPPPPPPAWGSFPTGNKTRRVTAALKRPGPRSGRRRLKKPCRVGFKMGGSGMIWGPSRSRLRATRRVYPSEVRAEIPLAVAQRLVGESCQEDELSPASPLMAFFWMRLSRGVGHLRRRRCRAPGVRGGGCLGEWSAPEVLHPSEGTPQGAGALCRSCRAVVHLPSFFSLSFKRLV